jgi:RNA-directed DNA polymerase
LTNIMMYRLDEEITDLAVMHMSAYTRYADDIFISSDAAGKSSKLFEGLSLILSQIDLPKLHINSEKTRYLSKKAHREVTGLIVTPQGMISLGRDRKRMIKSKINDAIHRKLDESERGWLAGYINWIASADPAFLDALRRKYGPSAVSSLRQSP